MSKLLSTTASWARIVSLGVLFFSLSFSAYAAAPINSTPVLFPLDGFPVQLTVGKPITYQLTAFDPDSDALSFAMTPAINGAFIDPLTGLFNWTPTAAQVGAQNLSFSVSDGIDTDTLSVAVSVIDVQTTEPPALRKLEDKRIYVGKRLTFKVTPVKRSESIVVTASGLPRGASFNQETLTFSWTPDKRDIGTSKITFTATDGTLSASRSVKIEVKQAKSSHND